MKRYLLFSGSDYYPEGGWDDFKGSFDTPRQAVEAVTYLRYAPDWYHVIDGQTGVKMLNEE